MLKKLPVKLLSLFLGFWAFSAYSTELVLNTDEQKYLNEHPVINMCVDPDWLPYEKLDEQGNHIGLVANYMSLFQSRLNVRFRVISSKNWEETQTLYSEGFCDIVSALNQTVERDKYLNFTQPYLKSPAVLVLNENNKNISHLIDLNGKTLGMVKGYVYDSKLRQDYPEIKIIYLENMEVALKKVAENEVDATLGPLFLSFALTQELNLDNLTIMGNSGYQDELSMGTRKNNSLLTSLMDKVVQSLTSEDHASIKKDWAEQRKDQ
ncbi:MAG: transporter substrate-binding domain-containing protein [Gammaproteobacteria bacterium]|nr:transporter substrate-binding domain-containing protein [Gammaproteobacteria bacterium]